MKLNRCVACGTKPYLDSTGDRFSIHCPGDGVKGTTPNDCCPQRTTVHGVKERVEREWNYRNPWRPMVGDKVWALTYDDNNKMYMKQAIIYRIKVDFPYIGMENIDIRHVFETEEDGQAVIDAATKTAEEERDETE